VNTTDILIIVGILLFVVLGFRDGFFKKIFGILGFLGGLICATKFMQPLGNYIASSLNFTLETSLIVAFFAIFIFFIIILNLLYKGFGRSGGDTLKIWSRVAGGLLGAVQGAVAVSLILLMFDQFGMPDDETKQSSLLYDQTYQFAPIVFDYTTRWIPDSKKFFEELKGTIEDVKIVH
jgi:membrane protein required for colicin V production